MGEANKIAMEEKAQEKDKVPRPPSSMASDDAEVKVPMRFYRRKSCQLCCGATVALVLAILIMILVLSFTEFKARDPMIHVTGMSVNSFKLTVESSLQALKLDVSLHINVTVHNPNVASFKYENSSTLLFYRGREVGRAAIPKGRVLSKKTERLETDLEIQSLELVLTPEVTNDLTSGIIPVSTYSSIRGTLNVINIFKHHAISTTECSANIFVSNTTLRDFKCNYTIKL